MRCHRSRVVVVDGEAAVAEVLELKLAQQRQRVLGMMPSRTVSLKECVATRTNDGKLSADIRGIFVRCRAARLLVDVLDCGCERQREKRKTCEGNF